VFTQKEQNELEIPGKLEEATSLGKPSMKL